ncbi:putative enoyl-CoA hydratase, mitochondrial [Cyanidiococcus yangmingshanensis]|uniref:Putative enoyl-CoA hydratase, mitochondrial n=1 Tax=Cyanidiococcus yangmingshanensis TaxID=2690220 RepID=A0A7J7II14_9RHOD|nr:putative enoyl-CoA hydratase, mitochondrial [Cyanidiococcus yangmingshanensis]
MSAAVVFESGLRSSAGQLSRIVHRFVGLGGRRFSAASNSYNNLQVEVRGSVGLVAIHRPAALNALNDETTMELADALQQYDRDSTIGAIVLTGTDRAFAAGADIKEMANRSFVQTRRRNAGAFMDLFLALRSPVIAAVRGYALGGGCELAMACDIVYASEDAQFGLPEVQIGTIPGWGGTQRLLRAVGKAKAMEMILSGRRISAKEAEEWGLVSAIHANDKVVAAALETAGKIASLSQPIVQMAKAAVNAAEDMSLRNGILYERSLFQATFATQDQKEGMTAFVDKRDPKWTNA